MWDLKSDRPLKSKDIFCSSDYASVLRPILRKKLVGYFNINPDNSYFVVPRIDDNIDNYDFLMQNDKLIAVYQPYIVSSGASGIVGVLIPDSEISHLLCLP